MRLWGAAQALRDASGVRLSGPRLERLSERLQRARTAAEIDAVDDAYRSGTTMDPRRAISDALASLRS